MTTRVFFRIVFAATALVYAAMILWSLPQISRAAGGLLAFDLRPTGYDLPQVQAFLDALGPEARRLYLGPQHMLDTFYPALLLLTLGRAIFWGFKEQPLAVRLALILPATAGMILDYLENIRVAALLRAETVTEAMVQAASFATIAKSVAMSLAMIVVLIGLGLRLWQRWNPAR